MKMNNMERFKKENIIWVAYCMRQSGANLQGGRCHFACADPDDCHAETGHYQADERNIAVNTLPNEAGGAG
jgi:hypothetical protein